MIKSLSVDLAEIFAAYESVVSWIQFYFAFLEEHCSHCCIPIWSYLPLGVYNYSKETENECRFSQNENSIENSLIVTRCVFIRVWWLYYVFFEIRKIWFLSVSSSISYSWNIADRSQSQMKWVELKRYDTVLIFFH